jgi:hypothetical protein
VSICRDWGKERKRCLIARGVEVKETWCCCRRKRRRRCVRRMFTPSLPAEWRRREFGHRIASVSAVSMFEDLGEGLFSGNGRGSDDLAMEFGSEWSVGNYGVQRLRCLEVRTAWRCACWRGNGGRGFVNLVFMRRSRRALWSTMDCVQRVPQSLCKCNIGFQILVSLHRSDL